MNLRTSLALFTVLALAGCHRHSDDQAHTATSGTVKIVLSFDIAPAAAAKSPTVKASKFGTTPVVKSYVSAKTQSVKVELKTVNGVTPATAAVATINVVAGTDCTTSGSTLNCTVSLDAPVGTDGLEVSTYAQPAAAGGAISIGETTVTVVGGAATTASVNLLPVVALVVVTLNPTGLPIGTAGTFTATVTAKDVTGDVIGGTDNYFQPLTVTSADLGTHVTASPGLPATLTSPQQNTITFTYDGGGSAASYSFRVGGPATLDVSYGFTSTLEHLYVVTQFANAAVYVYDIQSDGTITGPSRTIMGPNTTLNRPTKVAVDDLGRIFVVNYGEFPTQGDNVAVFAPGADGNVAPAQVLLQGSNPFYVSAGAEAFLVHPDPTSTTKVDVVVNYFTANSIPVANGIDTAIPPYDEPNANGFASFYEGPGTRGFLCVTSSTPADNGNGALKCITAPVQWVTGNIDPGTSQIVNGEAINAVYCCTAVLQDLMFLPDASVVVASSPGYMRAAAVTTYVFPQDLTQTVNLPPLRSISGSNTGLVSPTSIARDSKGNIYVADTGNASGNGSVHVYAPDADGNVAAIRVLAPFNYPFGIAIGK